MFLKFCKAAVRVRLAGKSYVTRNVFLSRSLCCGSQKQQQVRDAQVGLHNCNTFRNKTLINSNKFISIVTLRHNISKLCWEKSWRTKRKPTSDWVKQQKAS